MHDFWKAALSRGNCWIRLSISWTLGWRIGPAILLLWLLKSAFKDQYLHSTYINISVAQIIKCWCPMRLRSPQLSRRYTNLIRISAFFSFYFHLSIVKISLSTTVHKDIFKNSLELRKKLRNHVFRPPCCFIFFLLEPFTAVWRDKSYLAPRLFMIRFGCLVSTGHWTLNVIELWLSNEAIIVVELFKEWNRWILIW